MAKVFSGLVIVAVAVFTATALDNGLGRTPQMGYSSWNDCGSYVTEEHIKATANYMISSGLAAKGYHYVNVDEGWFLGRDAKTNKMIEDKNLFPSGMKGLGEYIHNLEVPGKGKIMKYGLYTSRGIQQCDTPEYMKRCMHTPPNPPKRCEGTHGYEEIDAEWMVDAGADYLKEDSCGGSQNHSVAFSDYAKMRDALNKTGTKAGRTIFFSLCGWCDWYAPPDPSIHYGGGKTLGNSFRIHGDGSNWDHLSGCTNTMQEIRAFSNPYGWADPDLLIGPGTVIGGQTDLQARTQFNLWSTFPAPLLISQNMSNWSSYALETYSNEDVIAINQDFVKYGSAARLVGGDLAFPCTNMMNCTNVWGRVLSDGESVVLTFVNNANNTNTLTCDAACMASLAKVSGVPVDKNTYTAKDLWSKQESFPFSDKMEVKVDGMGGSRIFRLTKK